MKIFFAYSSRGGPEDQGMYFQIAQLLRRYGTVFSDRLGDVETSELGSKEKNVEIYRTERSFLRDADYLVAEVSEPSLGVGYEIGLAEQADMPVLCLFYRKASHRISAMVAGNERLMVREYQSMMDVDRIVRNFLSR